MQSICEDSEAKSICEDSEANFAHTDIKFKPGERKGGRKGILRRWSYFSKARTKTVVPTRSDSWATLPKFQDDVNSVMATAEITQASRRSSKRERIGRANSIDSVYRIDDTIQVPNDNRLLASLAKVLNGILESNSDKETTLGAKDPFFCPSNRPQVEEQDIVHFLTEAYRLSQWSTECNVIAMVLVTRLNDRGYAFQWQNWNRVLLCALLVAQKIWDDHCLGNVDIPFIWQSVVPDATDFTLKDANLMEQQFLNHVGWNTHVNRQVYTKVYFELRAIGMADLSEDIQAVKPLTEKELEALEIRIKKGAELLTQQEKARCVVQASKTVPSKYTALSDRRVSRGPVKAKCASIQPLVAAPTAAS
jgi:hypothetical protein